MPIIVDAAGQVYPTDGLSKYVKMGADLVAYGAKYFGAVNSSGILTGRKDRIETIKKLDGLAPFPKRGESLSLPASPGVKGIPNNLVHVRRVEDDVCRQGS